MCGIAAILSDASLDPGVIDRMTSALTHRGPDDLRVARLPGCELGHTRLSILDRVGGVQPMDHPAGRWTIVFNGEIYNHADLRQQLERRGVVFRTRSDTEVLLHAYVELGPACLKRLNGQFAFAVWDRDRQELFAARDRFGEKPLYWARASGGQVLLASEIKAIEASGLVSPRIDLTAVEMYLGLYYVPPDRTVYRNIHTLPPGHAVVWRRGEGGHCDDLRAYRWWSPRLSHLKVDREEAVTEIRRLLSAAVRRQMIADVPVGAFLSGGLDSSSIVALMAEHGGRTQTFAAGFDELIDELPFAREVAERYETTHHESHVERIDVAGELAAMAAIYDEPFGDSSNIPTTLISRQARQGVTVALSGDGGDELFGGYAWYEPAIADLVGGGRRNGSDPFADHIGRTGPIADDRRGLWGDRGQPAIIETLRQRFDAAGGVDAGMDVATGFDVGCYLAGDILVKVDRAAMSCGLETRAAFLDADLADFVLGLPWQMRFGIPGARALSPECIEATVAGRPVGVTSVQSSRPTLRFSPDGRTVLRSSPGIADGDGSPRTLPPLKSLLRDACGDLWPASIRSRNKQGFGAPVRHWLHRPEVDDLWRRVTSVDGPLAALLPGAGDSRVTEALRPQRKWSLLCLGMWLERRAACLAGLR